MRRRTRKRAKLDQAAKQAGQPRTLRGRARQDRHGTSTKAPWVAPKNMPEDLVALVVAGKMCGAEMRNGNFCTLRPFPGQGVLGRPRPHRCKWHGGGVPLHLQTRDEATAKRMLRHGIYAEAVLPGEEEDHLRLLSQKGVDDEIAMLKLRLKRAVRVEAQQQEAIDAQLHEDAFEMVGVDRSSEVGPEGVKTSTTRRMEAVDYGKKIHAIVLEIAKLMMQRALEAGQSAGPDEQARLAREALKEAREGLTKGRKP